MTRHRRAFAASKVRPASSERMQWRQAIEAGRTVAARVLGTAYAAGQRAELAQMKVDLAHLTRRLSATAFPSAELSARALAEAFVAGARALAVVALEDREKALAEVVEAAGRALDGIVEDLRALEARRSWGRQVGHLD